MPGAGPILAITCSKFRWWASWKFSFVIIDWWYSYRYFFWVILCHPITLIWRNWEWFRTGCNMSKVAHALQLLLLLCYYNFLQYVHLTILLKLITDLLFHWTTSSRVNSMVGSRCETTYNNNCSFEKVLFCYHIRMIPSIFFLSKVFIILVFSYGVTRSGSYKLTTSPQ